MRTWFGLGLVALAWTVGCGDDETNATGTTGSGAQGGAGNTGGVGNTGNLGGAGGGAGGLGGEGGTSACGVSIPTSYTGASYETNAAVELAVRAQHGELQAPMSAAEGNIALTPTGVQLQALFDAGTPSLRDLTTPYYAGVIEDTFTKFEAAAGNTWTPTEPPAGPGGILGTHIYDAQGTDLRQVIDKGLFNAAYYGHAVSLVADGVTAIDADRLVAIYGAHPTFPGDSGAVDPVTLPNPDRFAAQYAERRSEKNANDASLPADPQDPGPYFRMKDALIRIQVLADAGPDCEAELDAAVEAYFADWELTMFATVIYYLNAAAVSLSMPSPTPAELDSGLHGYGEAVGFLHGFRTTPTTYRTVTDAQIDDMLATMLAPHDGVATSYKLATDPTNEVPKMQEVLADIVVHFGFTQQEVDSFKINY